MLWAPKLYVQGLRYPSGFDIGPATPKGYQLRVGMSYSLTDVLRSMRVGTVAETDCAVHTLQDKLDTALEGAAVRPENAASRAQADFLASHQAEVEQLVERARKRLGERVITLFELNHILSLAEQIERKAAQASGLASRREAATGADTAERDPGAMAGELAHVRESHEQSLSSLRAMDAWNLRLQGGVIPLADRSLDWFGWVELSYSLGGPFRSAAESSYRQARQLELQSDPHELPAKLERWQRQVDSQAEQAAVELRVVEKRLEYLRAAAADLHAAEPVSHEHDALEIEQLSAESERVFLETLIDSLAQERKHHSG